MRLPNRNYDIPVVKENGVAYGNRKLRPKGLVAGSNEQKLLAAFHNDSFNKEDVAKVLGISASGAYKLLERMKEQGLLNAKKAGKKWLYSIVLSFPKKYATK